MQTVFFTSLRKGCSLVLSYLLFPKPLTLQHILGGALISAGIWMNDRVRTLFFCNTTIALLLRHTRGGPVFGCRSQPCVLGVRTPSRLSDARAWCSHSQSATPPSPPQTKRASPPTGSSGNDDKGASVSAAAPRARTPARVAV